MSCPKSQQSQSKAETWAVVLKAPLQTTGKGHCPASKGREGAESVVEGTSGGREAVLLCLGRQMFEHCL